MRVWWILAQVSVIIFKTCYAGVCRPIPCVIEPRVLRFWYHEMEIDASSINVHEGDDVSITCDGACVGKNYNPYLRWYGPDRHWIASQEPSDRIYVERAWSNKYQKLHIRSAQPSDGGSYYCRGKLGNNTGWRLKSIILYIVPRNRHGDNHSSGFRHDHLSLGTNRPTRGTRSTRGPHRNRKPTTKQTALQTKARTTLTSTLHTTISINTKSTSTSPIHTTVHSESKETATTGQYTTDSVSSAGTKETTTAVTTEVASNCTWPQGFLCSNGDCISYDLRCDNFPDCFGEEDEDNCDSFFQSCSESEIACEDNTGCFSLRQLCDGNQDCQDGSDEFLYKCIP